jgi:multiple sugar transport system ATP-binding protein
VLQQVDTPAALYERPANAFVAGFIGSPSMNLNPADIEEGGARIGGTFVPLETGVLSACRAAGLSRIVLGVRPESLALSPNDGLAVDVRLVEVLGADAFVHGTIAGSESSVVVRCDGRSHPSIGETVHATVDHAAVHVFDPDSGERIG